MTVFRFRARMFLAIDIGNSLIKFGTYNGTELVDRFTISTKLDYTVEELAFDRFHVLDDQFIQLKFDSVYVSSVVPKLNKVIEQLCTKLFKLKAVFVNTTMDLGLTINYEPKTSLGNDRLVGMFSASKTYGTPFIVCSFGTATTIDAVSERSEFLGGLILPGMGTMADSLKRRTAKLPVVRIRKPESLLGNSTESAIAAGIFYAQIAAVEGIVKRIRNERFSSAKKVKIVATGGFSGLIGQHSSIFDKVDENLVLDGLRLISEKAMVHK